MPLDKETFRTRTSTAIVFTIVMLLGLLFNGWLFMALLLIIHFGCWLEFVRIIRKINSYRYGIYSLGGLLYISLPVLLLIACAYFPAELPRERSISNFIGNYSPVIPCGILFSIWINDTMAYIVGSFIGKTPLSTISPKKTWEGTIGGAVLCVIIITIIGSLTVFLKTTDWLVISASCALFGTLGDLFESKLKRLAGVKDSGSFMPGHGGFLDRFDSFLFATFPVTIYFLLVVTR